jgi:hypothetical protein
MAGPALPRPQQFACLVDVDGHTDQICETEHIGISIGLHDVTEHARLASHNITTAK